MVKMKKIFLMLLRGREQPRRGCSCFTRQQTRRLGGDKDDQGSQPDLRGGSQHGFDCGRGRVLPEGEPRKKEKRYLPAARHEALRRAQEEVPQAPRHYSAPPNTIDTHCFQKTGHHPPEQSRARQCHTSS